MSLTGAPIPEIRLLEMEANATSWPFVLVDGPEVVRSGVPPGAQTGPQIPLSAREPFGARSSSMGNPSVRVGSTAKVTILEGPPPGTGFRI